MKCKSCVDLLQEYQDGCLGANKCAEFEEHIAVCAKCRTLVKTYRLTVRLSARTKPLDDLTPEMLERLKNIVIDRFSTGRR